MSWNRSLGYRLAFPRRIYAALFDWRKKGHIAPTASIVLSQSATAKRLTYVVTATALNGSTLTYSVDPGDSSGLITTATGGRTFATGGTKTFTATVTDSNGGVTVVAASAQADAVPTDMALSVASFSHLAVAATTIGTLSTTDSNTGDVNVYTLVSGAGSTDNASFAIVGTALKVGAAPVAAGSYTVRVRVTDQNALTFEKAFALTST